MKKPFGNEKQLIIRGKVLRNNEVVKEGKIMSISLDVLVEEYNEFIDGMAEVIYHLESDGRNDVYKIKNIAKEDHIISIYIEEKYGKLIILDLIGKGLIPIGENGYYFAGLVTENKMAGGNTYLSLCVPYSEQENGRWVYKTKFVTVCFKKKITYAKKGDIKEIMIGKISQKIYNEKIYYSAPGLFVL